MTTIVIFDAAERELAREDSKSKAQRFSIRGRADQRQLDALAARHPAAVSGRIGNATFVIRNGASSWTGQVGVAENTLSSNLALRG